MPKTTEIAALLENEPGTFGRVCRAFAEHRVNIVGCMSAPEQGRGLVRFVVDNVEMAKKALDNQGLSYRETAVASIRFLHRPGELARAAARLGDAEINIDYVYCGVDPNTYMPVIIFGVADAELAASILDRSSAAA